MSSSPSGRDAGDAPRGRGEIVQFPPLPPLPVPPEGGMDPRQAKVSRIASSLASVLRGPMELGGPNLSRGFRASAVDLGALQAMLEQALARFDGERLRARWDQDVRNWIAQALLRWVQRLKSLKLRLVEDAVQIELETQDDRGYYQYQFEVSPGRKAS